LAKSNTEFLRTLHRLFRHTSVGREPGVTSSRLLREVREQVHPLGLRDIRLAKYVDGLQLLVDVGDRLGADVYYGSYPEVADLVLLHRVCPPHATVIDVGANYGLFSVLVACRPDFQGCLVAVEPVAEAAAVLLKNLEPARYGSVIVRRECLGAVDGEVDFHVAEESAFSGISDTKRSKLRRIERLKQCRLDSVVQELGISSVDVLKIDVEGHESDVLSGGAATIAGSPELVILMEISRKNLDPHRRNSLVAGLIKLREQGFSAWQIDKQRQPIDLTKVMDPERGDKSANNTFFVRTGSTAEERLLSEFEKMRRSEDGLSYLQGNVHPEPPLTADQLSLAERLSLAALAKRERQYAELESEHAKLQTELQALQLEVGRLRGIIERSLWHRIARLLRKRL
jgi:FkbM family methyltransferase